MASLQIAGAATNPGPHVFLVEDSLDNREVYSLFLQQSGYRVTEAGLGLEALALLEREPAPDIMVTDIVLPDIDGLELCRRMKAEPRLASTPVIAITALPLTEKQVAHAAEVGSALLLRKPCLPDMLAREIGRVLVVARAAQTRAAATVERSHAVAARAGALMARSTALRLDVARQRQHDAILRRMRAEYDEMPGLSLTLEQAQRLLGLQPPACQDVLDDLVSEYFLIRTPHGMYVRPGGR